MTTGDRLEWRTSSYSGNGENCVEVAPARGWQTSNAVSEKHASASGDCLVYVRHSKRPEAGTIAFAPATWMDFLREVRAGTASNNDVVDVSYDGTDTLVAAKGSGVRLRFDEGEWAAFVAGVNDNEFDATRFAR